MESFKSTLDEVREADVLLHVVDISYAHYEDQLNVGEQNTLLNLGPLRNQPLRYSTKMDKYEEQAFDQWLQPEVKQEIWNDLKKRWQNENDGHCVFVSATEREQYRRPRQSILR